VFINYLDICQKNSHFKEGRKGEEKGTSMILGKKMGRKGDVYDFMLFSDPYIEIFLQEIKTVREKGFSPTLFLQLPGSYILT
jgi:hypothetical protein